MEVKVLLIVPNVLEILRDSGYCIPNSVCGFSKANGCSISARDIHLLLRFIMFSYVGYRRRRYVIQ